MGDPPVPNARAPYADTCAEPGASTLAFGSIPPQTFLISIQR